MWNVPNVQIKFDVDCAKRSNKIQCGMCQTFKQNLMWIVPNVQIKFNVDCAKRSNKIQCGLCQTLK
jgi:hypothetical protein